MKPIAFDNLPYRPCVGVMVLNRDGLVWAGRRMMVDKGEMTGRRSFGRCRKADLTRKNRR